MTLPISTLEQLERLGTDRAKAIAKAVSSVATDHKPEISEAEVVPIGHGVGLVVIGPSRRLPTLECLRVVQIIPGRFILSVRSGTSPDSLEVALADMLETVPEGEASERSLLAKLLAILRAARKTRRMTKEEILLIGMG